jgi:hypothetical protein
MSKRQKEGQVRLPRGYKLVAYIAPIGIVTEGTKVQLDGSQSYFEYINNNVDKFPESATATRTIKDEDRISFLWEQTEGPPISLDREDSTTPSFTAPYVDLNTSPKKIYASLKFKLVIRDRNGISSQPWEERIIVKIVQRALVLQGGGALGAYEAGVFKALCEDLAPKNENNNSRM